MNTIYTAITHRRSSVPGVVPTIPVSSSYAELDTDIYDAEIFINTADGKQYFRAGNNIISSYTTSNKIKNYELSTTTTDEGTFEIYITGTTSRIPIVADNTYKVKVELVGHSVSGIYSATATIIYTYKTGESISVDYQNIISEVDTTAGSDFDVSYDDTNKELIFNVVAPSENMNWYAKVDIIAVSTITA